jgi:hypothetical protein
MSTASYVAISSDKIEGNTETGLFALGTILGIYGLTKIGNSVSWSNFAKKLKHDCIDSIDELVL